MLDKIFLEFCELFNRIIICKVIMWVYFINEYMIKVLRCLGKRLVFEVVLRF